MGQQNSAEERRKTMEAFKNNLYDEVITQNSLLLCQPFDVICLLLKYLDTENLQNLSSTCKAMHMIVVDFLKHECHISRVMQRFNKFLVENKEMLTMWEKHCLDQVDAALTCVFEQEKSVEKLTSKERRKIWLLTKKKELLCGEVTRISTTDERVCFPHRGSHYIPVEEDAGLGRKVSVMDNVCWLCISTTFPNVNPGTYICSLIIRVNPDARMPLASNEVTEWILSCHESVPRTGREFWNQLIKQRTPSSELCDGLTIESVDAPNSNRVATAENREEEEKGHWIAVKLPPFRLEKKSDVTFEMKEVQCGWWKSGIDFDFSELRRIG